MEVTMIYTVKNGTWCKDNDKDGFKQDDAKLTTRGKDNLLGCLYKE